VTQLLLIRHGRSEWNAEGRIQGWADSPLDAVGQGQARRLAERLRDAAPVALYASPSLRARETADIIGQALDVPVTADERLKEHGVGDVTGLTWKQVVAQYPEVARDWAAGVEGFEIPGEEEIEVFHARVTAAFDEIVARHPDETVGVVSHGGTLGMYLNSLLGLSKRFSPFRFANASLTVVEVNSVRPRIVCLNDTCHLGGEA
jgi:broad specificity phosphatase PhoE